MLEVEAANAKGVAFYRKHGFVEAANAARGRAFRAAGAGTAHRLYEKLLVRETGATAPCLAAAVSAIRRIKPQRPSRPSRIP